MAEADAAALAVTSDGSSSGQLAGARDVERHRPSVWRSAHLDSARDSARDDDPATARAQSPRARTRPSVPDERGLGRLARALRLPDRREHRQAAHRARGRRSCRPRAGASAERRDAANRSPGMRRSWCSSPKTRAGVPSCSRCTSACPTRSPNATTCQRVDMPFDRSFHVASKAEWQTRYENWLRDPVRTQMYLARPLFDLRPVHGRESLWRDVEATVVGAVDRDFLHVLANDCLASLPPLTFFQDAVVEESGEHTDRLSTGAQRAAAARGRRARVRHGGEKGARHAPRASASRPPERCCPSTSRSSAKRPRPCASCSGSRRASGSARARPDRSLPPALLSRHDRHVLKSGFRSILRLLEFTGNSPWFATL